jgi:hypothetical protein
MEIVTYVGTIASVVGLLVSYFAWGRARGAQTAAKEARQEVRNLQAPWRLHDLEVQLTVLRKAVVNAEWRSCESLARVCETQAVEFSAYLRDQLSEDECNDLLAISTSLSIVGGIGLRRAGSHVETADGMDVLVATGEVDGAIDNVAKIRGAMRLRAER